MAKVKFEAKVARQHETSYHITVPSVIRKAFNVKSGDRVVVALLEEGETLIDLEPFIEKDSKE